MHVIFEEILHYVFMCNAIAFLFFGFLTGGNSRLQAYS